MIHKRLDSELLPTDLSDEEVRTIFRRLRALLAKSGDLNQHELAILLIGACIMEGFNTGKRIIGALEKLGFNKQHVGMMLRNGSGEDPERYYWRRTPLGTYEMLEAPAPLPTATAAPRCLSVAVR